MPIVKFHRERNEKYLDEKTIEKYLEKVNERYETQKITLTTYKKLLRGVRLIWEMHETGRIQYKMPSKNSKYQFSEYYEKILEEFGTNNQWHPNTRGDIIWVTRKFFAWLEENGIDNLEKAGATEIQKFMINCSQNMKTGSIQNVKIYLKKLCSYLTEKEYLKDSYNDLLSFKVYRENKLSPAVSHEEIANILETINRRTEKGKRDYAMILLGVVTGLRAGDIAKLKLTDIDWKSGEIKIVQSKTGKSLSLPLTTDVGEAIKDYIMNVRKNSVSNAVFLRCVAPFTQFTDGVAIENVYDSYCLKAGIQRSAFDGKGFHSLRRSLGKSLVVSGVSVEKVAQILGHEDVDSAKQYISLDSEHLKECALDFSGIGKKVRI